MKNDVRVFRCYRVVTVERKLFHSPKTISVSNGIKKKLKVMNHSDDNSVLIECKLSLVPRRHCAGGIL